MSERLARDLLREALVLDRASNERGAIPLYRRAIREGLKGKDLHTALVCLGSSLRTVGKVKAAIRVLQKARRVFPNDPTVAMFLAMTHRDAGQHDLAIRQLGDMLLKESGDPTLKRYREALRWKYHALR